MSFLPPSESSFLPASPTAYRGPRSRSGLRILATAMLVFSILFVGLYGWSVWDQAANGIDTDAVVTSWGEDKDRLFVRFTTEDGQVVRTSFDEPGRIEDHPRGSTIRVRYVPRDPRIARPAEEPPVQPIIAVVGVFFLVLTSGFAIYAWRYAPERLGRRGR